MSSRPLRGQAALWSPRESRWARQERPLHLLAAVSRGRRSRRRSSVRKRSGVKVVSGVVGIRARCRPPQRPPWESSIHCWSSVRLGSTTSSLNRCSRAADAWYCHPCFHSPGSGSVCCGRAPSQTSCHVGHAAKPSRAAAALACSASWRHEAAAPVPARRAAVSSVAAVGFLCRNMGSASAQDAQYAHSAVRAADRSPRPPRPSGSELTRKSLSASAGPGSRSRRPWSAS